MLSFHVSGLGWLGLAAMICAYHGALALWRRTLLGNQTGWQGLWAVLLLVGLIIAIPATAETCKAGQRKLHGRCVPARVQPAPAIPTIATPGINGAVRVKRDEAGKIIGPLIVRNAYRAVETDAGVDTPGIVIRDLTATGLTRDGIRLRNAPGAVIERFDLRHADAPSTSPDLPEGIAITSGTGITIRNGSVSGFRMVVMQGKYTNGDGIAPEGGTSGTITGVTASDNSDAGFDLKGEWLLDQLTAERNGRGFRGWDHLIAGTLTARDNGSAVWAAKGAIVTIDKLVASSSKPAQVFTLEGQVTLMVAACDLTGMARGSVLVKSNGSGNAVTLGPGCKLP